MSSSESTAAGFASLHHMAMDDFEANRPNNPAARRLPAHAQTHIRLASFTNASPALAMAIPAFSPSSSVGGGSGSFKNPARSFLHGSYYDETQAPPAHPSSDVRDYTAEIASMALDDVGSADPNMMMPLPPPIEVPPLSSKASSSTLTALLRSASATSDTDSPLRQARPENDQPSIVIGGGSSSGSSDRSSPVSGSRRPSEGSQISSQNGGYGFENDEMDPTQPLLHTYGDDASRTQYGSEFAFEDNYHARPSPHSRTGSWLRPNFMKRNYSGTSTRTGIAPALDGGLEYASSARIMHRAKPFFASAGKYIHDCRADILYTAKYVPSVILGVLLNVLDGLSYGMILFPLGEPIFSALGPEGLSMFYVSCIVSQLVYSFGGSAFKGGVGSEMIEVVPFFHSMAYTLLAKIGEDKPDSVLATTILAYAISSIVTGAVFFGLGFARIGSLIGFFPRHILVGCIGGVGWFLIATGLEVSSRLEGNLAYNIETAKYLFQPIRFLQWIIPLLLAIVLIGLEHFIKHPLLVPVYFIIVMVMFHVLVSFIPDLSLPMLRDLGWVFASPDARAPWYSFYRLYKFSAVDWSALASTIPAMFALTFFGILHVPINVPALSVSLGEDNIDVDRELIAHGISNALSGCCGSIQNYLVYTNSLLFIRSGGDSRVAGFMLAAATTGVMIAGPVVIGFIPVMVVGALIFLLGIELMREALYDTWGRVSRFEYYVIVVIIVAMALWDFVYGIVVGIILACMSYVISSSRRSAIKATYSGTIARSTVRRHPFQQRFLKEVGEEIFVVKLSGFLFFGTIVSVESRIRELLLSSQDEQSKKIKYLVIDFQGVGGVDFSAAEAFTRMQRLLQSKEIELVLCSLAEEPATGLKAVGLWEEPSNGIHVYEDLNSALEWCENQLLAVYYHVRDRQKQKLLQAKPITLTDPSIQHLQANSVLSSNLIDMSSPRKDFIQKATSTVMLTDPTFPKLPVIVEDSTTAAAPAMDAGPEPARQVAPPQPLTLLLQIIHDLSPKPASFWDSLCSAFVREEHKAGEYLYRRADEPHGFYIVESGILKAEYDLDQGRFAEAIVAGTTAGELPFFSDTRRTASMYVERDAVVWKLSKAAWSAFVEGGGTEEEQAHRGEVAMELYRVVLKLTAERFSAITAYVLTSAG
ncbi:sulfate transporter family-domain-containing protein [Lipomyces tetrasporus]|uniref:Sulfate transporter family-domain-containing protein n=1 Tax=Lipomyces tetrasporus TaxID=54092 RepID=A0AAD7VW28_9ASCO|nr:sulfate transporter family-domain-containing protein [Lipomyces tetrasporus]KAJ8102910.1 sulfate transporter family-domain-containing protein [Lipomyces tetrasporus]